MYPLIKACDGPFDLREFLLFKSATQPDKCTAADYHINVIDLKQIFVHHKIIVTWGYVGDIGFVTKF